MIEQTQDENTRASSVLTSVTVRSTVSRIIGVAHTIICRAAARP